MTQPQEFVPTTAPVTRTHAFSGRGPARLVHQWNNGRKSTVRSPMIRFGSLSGLAREVNPQARASRTISMLIVARFCTMIPYLHSSFCESFCSVYGLSGVLLLN